ncbi:hypothetical protein [Xanthomonas phage BUDD]|nr:hypothetical protein [Xanthomonas phage BUDD]
MNPIVENDYTYRINQDPESAVWKTLARQDKKVEAIKTFRANTGANLLHAKQVVEHYVYITDAKNLENGVQNPQKTRVIQLRDARIVVTETVPGFYKVTELSERDLGTVSDVELLQFLADHVITNGFGMPRA